MSAFANRDDLAGVPGGISDNKGHFTASGAENNSDGGEEYEDTL